MFTHTRVANFARPHLIVILLIAVALAGAGAAGLWRSLSVSAAHGSSASATSTLSGRASRGTTGSETGGGPEADKARVKREYGRLPMNFEVNQGQADSSVKFLSRGHGYQVFLTDGEAALVLQGEKSCVSQPNILRVKPVGARAGKVSGYDLLPTKSNYLIGNDPSHWRAGVANYARVEYSEIYPGINLAFYGTQQALEYDFIVAPGADPGNITINIEGADQIELDVNGDLVLRVAGEKVYHRSPLTYQNDRSAAGARRSVRSRYVLKGGNQVGFAVDSYDASKPLVIDPVIDFSTYLGGAGDDQGLSIAIDASGAAYITGSTSSNDYTTQSPIQPVNKGGSDVFVTKISAGAPSIAFSTYFGGGGSDVGAAIAVDSVGNCYVTGATTSTDLPTRAPFQPTNRGGNDAFVAKFNAAGSDIIYSTYLGGTSGDVGRGVAVDLSGSVFVTGSAASADFTTTVGAFQATNRGQGDAFVARVNPAGTALVYSSFLGGAGADEGAGLSIDDSGNAYVVGATASGDFNTSNPLQNANRGQQDVFVAKVNSNGSALIYSTYLGGQGNDVGTGIAVDFVGVAHITGSTASSNFPLKNPLQGTYGGGDLDAFVTKINAEGSALLYSSYLGGSLVEVGNSVAVDPFGNIYVTGVTNSLNFPTLNPIQAQNRGGADAFVTKLGPSGTALIYSTYLGGGNDDRGAGLAVDSVGTAYVSGSTSSPNFNTQFPLVGYGGGSDVFVAKLISEASLALTPSALELQPQGTGKITVSISAPQSTPLTVSLTSSNTAVATAPPSVTIPVGKVSADFNVTAVAVGGPVTITAALAPAQGGATATTAVTVVASNRFIQAASMAVAAGGQLTMPIELISQGNENRLSFSVSLDHTLLLNPQFTLGADATGASLNFNQSQVAQGRYGFTVALPPGDKFDVGVRQILVLSAGALTGVNGKTTTVNFTTQPTTQRTTDVNNVTLNVSYVPGTVTIAQNFEGDVSPRPGGNSGAVTVADWTQTGRFAAGFDTVTAGGEFQRADTAPRLSFGDGIITIADWVQTGRYTAGLDPIAVAGGPTGPSFTESRVENRGSGIEAENDLQSSILDPRSSTLNQQSRVVRVVNVNGQRGQQALVTIEVDALGTENALGFSLNFNPGALTFVSAVAGPDAADAMFNLNSMQAANGRVGVAMALEAGKTFTAGTKKLVTVTFTIPSGGTEATIPITFGDQPVAREVVSVNAEVLQTTWTPGAVVFTRSATSVSAASFVGGELASEQIVAAYGTGLATTTLPATTLPLPTTLGGTTVSVRDSQGVSRPAPIFFVSPPQVNYQMPPGSALGTATVTVTSGDGVVSVGNVTIASVAPGIFTANSTGQGVPAAIALRVKADGAQSFEQIVRLDAGQSVFVPVPIDLGPEGEQVFLILFGTGWRGAGGTQNSSVTLGGTVSGSFSLSAQGDFVGLDQSNILIPRSLAGRGEIDLVLTVNGKAANTVKLNIR